MKRAAVIFNPVAGSGRAEEISAAAERRLSHAGWHVERKATRRRDGATLLASELAPRIDYLVVVGGDGSIREAIAGLGSDIENLHVGIVPLGNANVVARELGIPRDPALAIDNLLSGAPVPVDIAFANSELFLAMVGVGWDALTVANLRRLRETSWGGLSYRTWADSAYLIAGLAALCRIGAPRFRIVSDRTHWARRYCAAILCNYRTYSKGWSMAPEAHFQSGRIHLQARFRSMFLFVAWQLMAAIICRRSPRFISDYGSGETIRLQGEEPFPFQVDGDFRGYTNQLEIRVQPAAVRFVVPLPAGGIQTPVWSAVGAQSGEARVGAG